MGKNKSKTGSKSALAIELSRLEGFYEGKVRLEQYTTPSEIAADMLWNAYLLGDIEGKVSVDLGCGTGILGIGYLLLGAKKVFFVDIDENALSIAKNNIMKVKSEDSPSKFILGDIGVFKEKVDVVVENPPFGTKVKHNDTYFLEKAFKLANTIYSFHKSETLGYLEGFALKRGFEITHKFDYNFPLSSTYEFHRKRLQKINVTCLRFCRRQEQG